MLISNHHLKIMCAYDTLLFFLLILHSVSSLNAAPSAPLNLTFPAGSVLNDSITLTWLPPEDPNGVIDFYQLQQLSTSRSTLVNTTHNSTTIVLSDLVPGTQYNFSVRAFTVAFGPFSAQLSVHTADGEDYMLSYL